jgi:hypothetical protein
MKKDKESGFESLLQKINLDECREFIRQYADKNADFKSEVEIYFSDKDGSIDVGKKYSRLIQKLINRYTDHGYISYRESFGFSEEVNRLLDTGYQLSGRKNFRDAFLIAKPALKELMAVITYADDSDGSIGDSIDYIVQLIATISQSAEASPEIKSHVFDFLQEELKDSLYYDYGDFGYDLFDIYQGLAVDLGKAPEFLAFVDSMIRKLQGEYENYRREYFLKWKIEFLKSVHRPDEAEKLMAQNMDIVELRQKEVDKAIENKDYIRAKALIKDGIQIAEEKKHSGTVSQWKKELLRIALLENDVTKVRDYARYFALDRGFNSGYYNQWKETYAEEEWKPIIEQYIQETTENLTKEHRKNKDGGWSSPHPPLLRSLAPVFIGEKYWDRLLALVKQENSLDATLQYHPHLIKCYPDELLDIYIPALEHLGERVNNRNQYGDMAAKMVKILKDIPNGKEKIQGVARNLIAKYPRRPAMREELNRVLK